MPDYPDPRLFDPDYELPDPQVSDEPAPPQLNQHDKPARQEAGELTW